MGGRGGGGDCIWIMAKYLNMYLCEYVCEATCGGGFKTKRISKVHQDGHTHE